MADKKQKQKIQAILKDLRSEDSKTVVKAIKSLESHGDPSVIEPLAELLLAGPNEKIKTQVVELLSSLKDSSVTSYIMDVVEDSKYLPIRQTMLSTIWNTKVDFSDYLDEFVEIATKGDFMEALDCLTIIENLEGPFLEESVLESQLHLKNVLESNEKMDEQKAHILSEIALKIKEINQNLQD